ncbi:MAG: Ribosomal protein acetylase RimI and related acetyltransferase [Clostridia bacterium]|nr:Ribosomal protein acetylase RimI and related acetyltransferase [Clostridia bacterium]
MILFKQAAWIIWGGHIMSELERKEIIVRKVETIDIDGIVPLCSQLGYPCTSDEVVPRMTKLMNDKEHIVFVAVNLDGKIVGWVHSYINKLFYADNAAEIGGIVVDVLYRGNGVGKKLMKAVEEWAKRSECMAVSLRSNSKRIEAHSFYNAIGYEKVKEQYTFRKYFEA